MTGNKKTPARGASCLKYGAATEQRQRNAQAARPAVASSLPALLTISELELMVRETKLLRAGMNSAVFGATSEKVLMRLMRSELILSASA